MDNIYFYLETGELVAALKLPRAFMTHEDRLEFAKENNIDFHHYVLDNRFDTHRRWGMCKDDPTAWVRVDDDNRIVETLKIPSIEDFK